MKRANITVSGLVQGVGFRYAVRSMARQHGLNGEVVNMEDGSVRIACEGEDGSIEMFIEAVRNAERPVEVDDIRADYSEPTGEYRTFRIVLGDFLEEMVEGHATGAMYLHGIMKSQDRMLENQDRMLENQDRMLENQDRMLGERDAA